VQSALKKVNGVNSVEVGAIDKATKSAVVTVKGTASSEALIAALQGTQYSAKVN
jgi:copper chaperone CopZ